uniref:Uncharacterized protein n=1 Tax=Cucumis melo TaxID=3656 RepID=A0A9I9E4J3_CUCME
MGKLKMGSRESRIHIRVGGHPTKCKSRKGVKKRKEVKVDNPKPKTNQIQEARLLLAEDDNLTSKNEFYVSMGRKESSN